MKLQHRNITFIFLLSALLFSIYGCSILPKQIDETKDWSAAKIHSVAKQNLDKGNYEDAIKLYEKLEGRFPFGRYAQQAQLEIAYAYYKNEDYEQALTACNRFIKLHPSHPRVDYAYYLKGLVNYRSRKSILEKIFPVDPSTRDPGAAKQAFFDFKELVSKFPNSKYSKDAKKRMLFLRNNLARHEVIVAKYYLDRGAIPAAINRSKYVLENYDQSPSVKAALIIMYKGYRKLGLDKLATDTFRILALNYPKHPLVKREKRRRPELRRIKSR